MGKEKIIHSDHKPLQFIQKQGKLQNNRHKKWSTYLQQFNLNIKYKTWSKNHVSNCLIRTPVAALIIVLHSYGHEVSEWLQLYQRDTNFATTYHLLGTGANVTNFNIHDGLLCHLFHLYVPTSECAKLIWEAHYRWMAGDFGVEETMVILEKHFYWPKILQDVNKYIISCTTFSISKPTIKKKGL
jgi:hypothetical protein